MKVIIMRGLPGSGKSTYLNEKEPTAVVCSADDFFVTDEGVYLFDPKKLPQAHQACMRKFLDATAARMPLIAVDNTNISLWECSPYVSVAEALGYAVEVIRVDADPEICAARNTHNVPIEAVRRMAARFEKSLPWWKERRAEV